MCDPRLIRASKDGDVIKDDKVAGLYIKATQSAKCWYLYYRTKSGVQRRPKLGEYPTLSLEAARRVARSMLEEVAKGNDPSKERQEHRVAPTLADLWARWRKDRGLAKKSADEDKRIWEQNIAPYFSSRKLIDLNYDDISGLHASMIDKPYMANRVLALLSAMLHYAHRPLKWIDVVPTDGVRRYKEEKRRRYMTTAEAQKIAAILKREEEANPQSVAYLYLLIFTGARCGEIRTAQWKDYDGQTIHLADSKTGAKTVHVPVQAANLLDALRQEGGTLTGIGSPTKLWRKIRKEAGCPDLRLHDLRHSFASAGISAGLSLAQIGELLGHSSPQTTARYAHLVEEAAKRSVSKTANVIEAMMGGV